MMDQPSIVELLEAERGFIEKQALPNLSGRPAFHARVAANALSIVLRELSLGPQSLANENERLKALLGHEGSLDELNRELSRRIKDGSMHLETPGLVAHPIQTTRDKVAIDQPAYLDASANLFTLGVESLIVHL